MTTENGSGGFNLRSLCGAGFQWIAILFLSIAIVGQTLDDDDLPSPASIPGLKVETVASGLEVPWSIVFPDSKTIVFSERPGRVRIISEGRLSEIPLLILENIDDSGENGLMGMALHPEFVSNSYIYLAYVYRQRDDKFVRVARYRYSTDKLRDPKTIIERIPARKFHAGTRIGFGPDKKLYITTGDASRQKNAQRLDSLSGKTLRLNDDGTIPEDNPFYGMEGKRGEIWSYGHRNAQGLAWQPGTGLMFQTEHGPSLIDGVSLFKKRTGGDEFNIVERGRNYGWAKISHKGTRKGMVSPLIEYSPAMAPGSGMFYNGTAFPGFRGNFFFGALKGRSIVRIILEGRKPVAQQILFHNEYGRIREVAEGPDGSIYFSTSNRDGRGKPSNEDDRIMRIVPHSDN
ncbi:MAG: PQQ-dependent sugar dehydrogenase [Acidobacteriota bacterium]|nr:PQQ-dependent sugar dehydrogenase [Acidobacteriota bacterium]MDH3531014.1 PQQ-dependent sugar dehydrogenase [Acidobacteriota bacterium]